MLGVPENPIRSPDDPRVPKAAREAMLRQGDTRSMATLWICDWNGKITSVEAEESENWYQVNDPENSDRYFKLRFGTDFFLAREHAEQQAVERLEAKIARIDFDIEQLKKKREPLQLRLDELGGGNP